MTEQTEARIPYDDLKHVALECACGAELTIDISPKDKELPVKWEEKILKCTICDRPFDSQIKIALSKLSHWYLLVKDSGFGQHVFFRVKKP